MKNGISSEFEREKDEVVRKEERERSKREFREKVSCRRLTFVMVAATFIFIPVFLFSLTSMDSGSSGLLSSFIAAIILGVIATIAVFIAGWPIIGLILTALGSD